MVTGIKYRPDIDVLRAFAVIPVVWFHLDKSMLPGGYLGVDVFFVISGYLITRLLVSELVVGKLDLLGFWRRRILRILPALIVMVAVTFVVGQWLLFAPEHHDLAINSAAALLSFSNITHLLNYGGYWGADAGTSPLLHTWSLGVEEQFYLLYPLFLLLCWRWRKSALKPVLALGLAASIAIFVYGLERHPSATFYLLPTRAWELAAGALASTINWNPKNRPYVAKGLAWTGLALVLCTYVMAPPDGIGYWSLGAVAGATLVVGVGTDSPFRSIGLTNRVFISIGLISYSLYLWHWPVIVLTGAASDRYDVAFPRALLLLIMGVLAFLSWRFVESPLRRAKSFAPAVAICALALAVAAFGLRGVNGAEDISGFKPTLWAGNEFNVNPQKVWPDAVKRRMAGIEVSGNSGATTHYADKGIIRQYGGKKIDVLVLGDSHGLMWAPVIDKVLREAGKTVSFMTADGTRVFQNSTNGPDIEKNQFFTAAQMIGFRNSRLRLIRVLRPELIVIAARWDIYTSREAIPLLDDIAASGAHLVLLGDPPLLDVGDRNLPQFVSYLGLANISDAWIPRFDEKAYQAGEHTLHEILRSCARFCNLVETADLFLERRSGSRLVHVVANNQVLYIDDDHLSVAGAELASGRIRKALTGAGQPASSQHAPEVGKHVP
jgi:peptidoglycan/LPS O-acetylase OafA/YrhL